jgi:hypothetical protein
VLTRETCCTREINKRIAIAKESFNRKILLLTSKLSTEFRKKLVTCYVWRIAIYDIKAWTLRKFQRKFLKSCGMWGWRKIEKIKWSAKVTNEQILEHIE